MSDEEIRDENEQLEKGNVERRGTVRSGGGGLRDRRTTHQIWLISYSDFMTILMIFFLAMYGYTYLAKKVVFKAHQKQMTYSEFSEMMQKLKSKLDDQLIIQEDTEKITLQLPDKVLFASGQADLSQRASRTIEELANSIKLVSGRVIVEGHTDNVPISNGPYRSNWELSAARAFSVIDGLTKGGVPPERLSAWGFGENRPVASNETRKSRKKNRRIEIVLLKKVEEEGGQS